MHDTDRPLPHPIPGPRRPSNPYPIARPMSAPHARGTAGASAHAQAARLRTQLEQSTHIRRGVQIGLSILVLASLALMMTVAHTSALTAADTCLAFVICTSLYERLARHSDKRRAQAADRWDQGACGEEATAKLLAPLLREGWHVLHDRAIPGTTTNLDHLLITPDGTRAILVDTKSWQRRQAPVTAAGGRLYYGAQDQTKTLDTARWEAGKVQAELSVTTIPVIAIHGTRIAALGPYLVFGNTVVVQAGDQLLDTLRLLFGPGEAPVPRDARERAKKLATRAALHFSAYPTR